LRRDVQSVVRASCQANLEFRQAAGPTHIEARDDALSAKLDEMLAAAGINWLPLRNTAQPD
jgi:hypothetical protein